MARVGLCKPYFGIYAAEGNAVSYTYKGRLAYAVDVDVSLDNADPVILYADNGPRESASGFSGGTMTMGIDELPIDIASNILGLDIVNVAASGSEHAYSYMAYEDAVAPYVGVGFIVNIIHGGTKKYLAVILTKAQFQVPQTAVTTQGETIEFQTPSLTATLLRDDQVKPTWRIDAVFDSEAQAESWIKTKLGYTE